MAVKKWRKCSGFVMYLNTLKTDYLWQLKGMQSSKLGICGTFSDKNSTQYKNVV